MVLSSGDASKAAAAGGRALLTLPEGGLVYGAAAARALAAASDVPGFYPAARGDRCARETPTPAERRARDGKGRPRRGWLAQGMQTRDLDFGRPLAGWPLWVNKL